MPSFLAKLTQRGHILKNIDDVRQLYSDAVSVTPSKKLMNMPHSTLFRMNYLTIAIVGLSTKAVGQIRTHAKRLTFISTSTQYSDYRDNFNCYVEDDRTDVQELLQHIKDVYSRMKDDGLSNDDASYILPQGLKKILICSGNLDDWRYVIKTRLCKRNTAEVQYIMKCIYNAIKNECGDVYVTGMLPSCVIDKCREGKFTCGTPFNEMEDLC
jgi:thymidylate synthase (FAD)